jgi:SAM-dependent methyltransferase
MVRVFLSITMFSESADYYDLIYGEKNYHGEAERLRQLFRVYVPQARSILDVGCGTGEHLRFLKEYNVTGIDLDPTFLKIAREKRSDGNFQVADMQRFELSAKFDILICLFSSIGYLLNEEAIGSALACFKAHLALGGAIFIEPWFESSVWSNGRVDIKVGEDDQRKVCRMMKSDREGDLSIVTGHYLFAEGTKIRYAQERHELLLLSQSQWRDLFRKAGLGVEYLADQFNSRGLYVAWEGERPQVTL